MFLFKKKKSPFVVTKRSEDTSPFIIPYISLSSEPLDDSLDHAASPLYGKDIKDEVYFEASKSNINKYDAFRETPLDTNKDPYHEFRKVPSKNKKEEIKEEVREEIQEKPIIETPSQEVENKEDIEPSFFKYEEKEEEKIDSSFHTEVFNVKEDEVVFEKKERKETPKREYKEVPKYEEYVPERARSFEVKKDDEDDLDGFDNDISYSEQELAIINSGHVSPSYKNFKLPPLSILKESSTANEVDVEWLNNNIETINKNLEAFKIDGQVVEYTSGPTFTR